jgi:AcrR family transcriptional regulator
MHPNETKDKFIELRAKGWSFDRIAAEIGVSKRTLLRWYQDFGLEIENLRQMELERLRERLLGSQEEQLETFIADYQRYRAELLHRKPQNLPQYTLFRIVSRMRDQLEQRAPSFQPLPAETSQPKEGQ